MLRGALTLFVFAALAAPAAAAVDPETQANFDRAAAYWNATPYCPAGVELRTDQDAVGANNARARGCVIWVGDAYQAENPAARCQTIVHEWGHLTGHDHTPGLPDDTVGVMVSYEQPASCAALNVPAAAPSPDPAVAAWAAYDAAYVTRAAKRLARSNCTVEANARSHRASRVAARLRCVRRYGPVRRDPPTPSLPRPR